VRVSQLPVSSQLVPMCKTTFADHGRATVVHMANASLREIPRVLRRVGLFLVVMSISIPVFVVGLLVVLRNLGH
jgi:hypothetical protein